MWQQKADPKENTATATSSSRAPAKGKAVPVKKQETHPDTSDRAQELFKDAEASQQVYNEMLQSFTNIQWFGRPEFPEPCKNVEFCGTE